MNNKRGAEMTVGTIIIIILALVVLVVLIGGFTTGWKNLWNNIVGYGGGEINVGTIAQACNVACTSGQTYDYCSRDREVKYTGNAKGDINTTSTTCKKIVTAEQVFNKNSGVVITSTWGVNECPSITCS